MSTRRLSEIIHTRLDPQPWPGRGLSPCNKLLVVAILLATACAIIGKELALAETYSAEFAGLELGPGLLFSATFLATLWSVVELKEPGLPHLAQRLHFALRWDAVLDLFIIGTGLIPLFAIKVMALRLVRLLRMVRLAKRCRMSTALRLLYGVVSSYRYELIVTLGLASTFLVSGASAHYWIEGDFQSDKFGSIPRALWWGAITLTTIGYGDMYPITAAANLAAVIIAASGVGLIAMRTDLLASAFNRAARKQ